MTLRNKGNTVLNVNNNDCTGCMMCADACPKNAISFEFNEGFWIPMIDANECAYCGACYLKCPSVKEISKKEEYIGPLTCYGLTDNSLEVRKKSTSGGFFYELASYIYHNEGYVVGAVFDNNMNVKHIISNNEEDLYRLMKSKYVQSDISGIYNAVKKLLIQGELVLFSGTPCQVAALLAFLDKKYTNLLTMDFICCGISSPLVFTKYKEYLEKKYKSAIKKIEFKNKDKGWRSIGTKIEFDNHKIYLKDGSDDSFMISFVVDGNNIRSSCYECKYRKYEHISDFTAGDFWGMEKKYKNYDDNMGTTALIINSEKGLEIYKNISHRFISFSTDVDSIAEGNYTLVQAKKPSRYRSDFLKEAIEGKYKIAIKKYSYYGSPKRICIKIKSKAGKKIKKILFNKKFKFTV